MDLGRTVYSLTQLYVVGLVVVALLTLSVVFGLFEGTDPRLAGIWFGVSGFGVLVLITLLLVHYSRQ